jgi:tRNA-splicing endonuclease subunit Sen54
MASRARWVEEAGAAEVVENRGKLWLTTGVTRAGKLYYNVEETGYAYADCLMNCLYLCSV